MALQPETSGLREVPADTELAKNAERLAWQAHQLAVEIADNEPNAITEALRRAAFAQWQPLFLDLPG